MSMTHSSHLIVAYYLLLPIQDPHSEVREQKKFLEPRDATSRIYVSEEGINCQMSALHADAMEYIEWLRNRPDFHSIQFKIDPYHEHVFPRLAIKYRRQLVAFDADVDLSMRGEHVSPAIWKEMLEKADGHLLLDIRNDYEWAVGRFAGAEQPPCQTSRGFKAFAKELKERVDVKNTPVMMYCTGGIRCEFFSALLKEDGFEKVYQLEGGVINYGQQENGKHWEGKLFVFDDRMTAPVGSEKGRSVGSCHHCGVACDSYYNCGNTDCNRLFLCCADCVPKHLGCCKDECSEAPRWRPYHQQGPHKPFRKILKNGKAKR